MIITHEPNMRIFLHTNHIILSVYFNESCLLFCSTLLFFCCKSFSCFFYWIFALCYFFYEDHLMKSFQQPTTIQYKHACPSNKLSMWFFYFRVFYSLIILINTKNIFQYSRVFGFKQNKIEWNGCYLFEFLSKKAETKKKYNFCKTVLLVIY